jgi:hypothetical protein
MHTRSRGPDHENDVESAPRIVSDEQGAILIIGVVFSFCLVGIVWFVMGIGGALAYRENLQNAADAVAFAGAVYDARGMNVLATLNLIMAAVLMILVIARLIQVIVMMVNLIACLIGAFFDPLCDITSAAEPIIEEVCSDIEDAVKVILPILHYTESAVAIVWPWIASGKSALASTEYGPKVAGGASFAYAQIPLGLDGLGSPSNWSQVLSGVEGAFAGTSTSRYGLPVTDDSYDNLCNYAAQMAVSLALSWTPFNNSSIDSTLGGLIAKAPWLFCGEDGGGGDDGGDDADGPSGSQSLANSGAGSQLPSPGDAAKKCSDKLTNANDDAKNAYNTAVNAAASHAPAPVGDGTWTAAQVKAADVAASSKLASTLGSDQKSFASCAKAAAQLDSNPSSSPPKGGSGGGGGSSYGYMAPKKLWDPETKDGMGSAYYAVWSTAIGSFTEVDAKPIQISSMLARRKNPKVGLVAGPPDDSSIGIAKAEFYYEPQTNDTMSQETAVVLLTDCMYNMRWRARLRRYKPFPAGAGGQAVLDLMSGNFSGAVSEVGQSLENDLPQEAKQYLPGSLKAGDDTTLPKNIIH